MSRNVRSELFHCAHFVNRTFVRCHGFGKNYTGCLSKNYTVIQDMQYTYVRASVEWDTVLFKWVLLYIQSVTSVCTLTTQNATEKYKYEI